ncbi:MAG: PKD domain-containing protein, partial [Ginsengibacter sp.]
MLQRKPMKLLYLFVSLLFTISVNAGKITGPAGVAANAGPDQTIYLTQTSSVTLNGSASSAGSYQWTEVSTDYSSGATITSPNSAVTTVTGLKQGVWYFQLSVTSNGITATDQVVVRVDYDLPPSNGTLIHTFKMDDNSSVINDRHDTSSYFPVSDLNFGQSGADPNHFFLFRDRLNGLGIDKENGKLYSTIQDGYAGTDGFPRSEVALADYDFTIDTLHTYTFEWKGYFPQNENYLTSWYQILTMFQIHGGVQVPTVFGFDLDANGNLISGDVYDDYSGTDYGKGPGLKTVSKNFSTLNNFFDNAHTIRVTVREGRGYAGQTAFIKIELDGVTTYYRNTGQVGSSHWDDYVKFGGLYDWNSAMVNGNDLWRGRKFQLVTEAFNVYVLTDNQSPTASAGNNQTITLPNNTVALSGSASDPDGTVSWYEWTQLSGPTGATINNPTSSTTSVDGLSEGVYQFELKVQDNQGATATSTTQVTVNAAANSIPTVNAGADQIITLPDDSVTLYGSANDSDGFISSWLWKKISGPAVTVSDSSAASTSITGLVQGTYAFELTVNDNSGAVARDTVIVKVNPAPIMTNKSPTANAGGDKTITLPTNSTELSGNGTDSDGTIVSYLWKNISSLSAAISDSSAAITQVKNLLAGSYQFELTVTDNKGATGKDTVMITVKADSSIKIDKSPVANAGSDQTITLPTDSVKLSGSGNDSDGTIASYSWSQISGNASTIVNGSSATTTVRNLAQGAYQFELTVTDDKGATGKDTMKVAVIAAHKTSTNKAPVANAGSDQTITLPTDSVKLSGSGNDSDGTIASYSWSQISGNASTIVNGSSAT